MVEIATHRKKLSRYFHYLNVKFIFCGSFCLSLSLFFDILGNGYKSFVLPHKVSESPQLTSDAPKKVVDKLLHNLQLNDASLKDPQPETEKWILCLIRDAEDHGRTDTASFYSNRGVLHSELGETDEAKESYKRALEIQLKNLGPEHVDVAKSYNNLGVLHSDLGETDEAKDCYKRALEIQHKKLGQEHVDVVKRKTTKQSGKHSELLFHARENLGRFNFPIIFSIICPFDI